MSENWRVTTEPEYSGPHAVTRQFERELCKYTGAPYAVAVNSCTAALMLAVAWHLKHGLPRGAFKYKALVRYDEGLRAEESVFPLSITPLIEIPKRTYVSVPMAIMHAGGRPTFRDEDWLGAYQLKPLPVWDSARYFTGGMFMGIGSMAQPHHPARNFAEQMVCVSFHAAKTLGIEQGGAILHDIPEADAWLRRARFDGRTEGKAPKDDTFTQIGWHCYLNPSSAAQGLMKLHSLCRNNPPLPNDDYPDLSQLRIFQ